MGEMTNVNPLIWWQNSIEEKKIQYWNDLPAKKYILEITKCCGYSTWVTVYKRRTIDDLYQCVQDTFEMEPEKNFSLYLLHQETKIPKRLEKTDPRSLREIFTDSENAKFLIPIYPVPAPIIYRVYLDDGNCHNHHGLSNDCPIHI